MTEDRAEGSDEISAEGQRGSHPPGPEEQDESPILRAMVRDPSTVFLYWRLSGAETREREYPDEGDRWALLINNLTTDRDRKVQIDPSAGNHYLEVSPGCAYRFSIGTIIGGTFTAVCSSRKVEMPAAKAADEVPSEKIAKLFRTGGAGSPRPGASASSAGLAAGGSESLWPPSSGGPPDEEGP